LSIDFRQDVTISYVDEGCNFMKMEIQGLFG